MRSALVPILLADPLPWAQKAEYAWDFLRDRARFGGRYRGVLANTPGWTFTRASTGYYTTTGGVLVPFASGSLRTGDRGALIEGAGTNLCLQSQTFDNASWTKTRSSISANTAVAPDGTTTADKLVEDSTATNYHVVQPASSIGTVTATETLSVYAKAAERSWILLQLGVNRTAYFNVSAGTIGTTSGSTTATITALANGWYRCAISGVRDTNNNNMIFLASGDGGFSYNGDGTSGIYIWGAQLEAASFPSSYIPTTTASATRAADSLSITGVSGLDYPLTLYAEFQFSGAGSSVSPNYRVALSVGTSGTYAERNGIYNVNGGVGGLTQTGGVTQAAPSVAGTVPVDTTVKAAYRAQQDNFIACKNGTLSAADISGGASTAPNVVIFGNWPTGSGDGFIYLRRAAIYSSAKSDAQLQAMTT